VKNSLKKVAEHILSILSILLDIVKEISEFSNNPELNVMILNEENIICTLKKFEVLSESLKFLEGRGY
jgi:hypothetical protein